MTAHMKRFVGTHRIVSWNVNGLRSILRKGALDDVMNDADIVCIQETKLSSSDVEVYASLRPNLQAYFGLSRRPGHAGVATFTRTSPLRSHSNIVGDESAEGRSLLLEFEHFSVLNLYVPHGGRDKMMLPMKLKFLEDTREFVKNWQGSPLVILGDLNVARGPADLERWRQNQTNTMYSPGERAELEKLISSSLHDTFREHHPLESAYTWWPYAYDARARNLGWRIDYALVDTALRKVVLESFMLSAVHGSDHCPIVLVLGSTESRTSAPEGESQWHMTE